VKRFKVQVKDKNRPPWIKNLLYNYCWGPRRRAWEPLFETLRSSVRPWSRFKGHDFCEFRWVSSEAHNSDIVPRRTLKLVSFSSLDVPLSNGIKFLMMSPQIRDWERILQKIRFVVPHVSPSKICYEWDIEKSIHEFLHHVQLHLRAKWHSNLIDGFLRPNENRLKNRTFLAISNFGPGLLGDGKETLRFFLHQSLWATIVKGSAKL